MCETSLTEGFQNAALHSAQSFRGIMNAVARPGTIEDLVCVVAPPLLSPAAGTLILTLCDFDTPIHLAGQFDNADLRDWITFHTSAPIVDVGTATFAIGRWEELCPIDRFLIGTPEYPDRSASLIVELTELVESGAILTGPGIRDTQQFGLPEIKQFQQNSSLYPLGLDFFFTCADHIAALPRSTQIMDASCM